MGVRIEDVAAAAGVSMKTVSRVLNHEPNVAQATRERVEAAVAELGYRPHQSARVLAGNRSYLIGLLYDNPSTNYLMEVELGALDTCLAHHYHLMLIPLKYEGGKVAGQLESLIGQTRIDGVLLTPPLTDTPELLSALETMRVPWASLSARRANQRIGVIIDEQAAARDMVAHLVDLGHRHIAHIRGHPAHGASDWRMAGYRQGLESAGLPIVPGLIVEGLFSFESGHAAAVQLLDLPRPPTAIFAANDDMAAGAISAICERGFSVPADISVSGFDDTPIATQIYPALTTVRQPSRDMGRVAAQELLKAIRSPKDGETVVMPYELQLRRSTSEPPVGNQQAG
mgnify:CR=1 FL=1